MGAKRRFLHPAGDRGDRPAPRREPVAHPNPDRRLDLHPGRVRHRGHAGRRQHAPQSSGAAGAGGGPGLLRPIPHSRRAQRPSIPHQRRHPAGGDQRVRAVARPAPDLVAQPDHRCTARGIRFAHRRHHRHHHQERAPGGGRLGIALRRQPWGGRTEPDLRRRIGILQLPGHGGFSSQRPRHRIPGWQFEPAPRPHDAVPRLRLLRGHPERGKPCRAHARHFGGPVSDPGPRGRAAFARLVGRWSLELSEPAARREPARGDAVRRALLAALGGRPRRAELAHRALLQPDLRSRPLGRPPLHGHRPGCVQAKCRLCGPDRWRLHAGRRPHDPGGSVPADGSLDQRHHLAGAVDRSGRRRAHLDRR